jgi:hypothetical protein
MFVDVGHLEREYHAGNPDMDAPTGGAEGGCYRGVLQDLGSSDNCQYWIGIVGWLESLSEAGTECAIVDGATNLQESMQNCGVHYAAACIASWSSFMGY